MDFSVVTNAAFLAFGIDATHLDPNTLTETEITVIKKSPIEEFSLGTDKKISQKFMVEIKSEELSSINRRDRITIGETTYEVIGDPTKDTQELVWSAMLDVYNA